MINKHPTNRAERRKINETKDGKRNGKQRVSTVSFRTVPSDIKAERKDS